MFKNQNDGATFMSWLCWWPIVQQPPTGHFPDIGASAHYIMVSKFQWKPFWLATQRDPQNDGTATPNRVTYDIFYDLKGTPHVDMPTILASSQKIIGCKSGKAELLNDTFINSNASLNQDVFPVCPSILSSIFTFDNICSSDVSRALRSLPAKRSSGSGEIPYQLLKKAGPGIVGPLTNLFNNKSLNLQMSLLNGKMQLLFPSIKEVRKIDKTPPPTAQYHWHPLWQN